jgi:alpha-D-xyloside xylohydrolase
MRPLFFEFPDDDHAHEIEDSYMLGSDILVAPVQEPGARSRGVYLPKGVNWTNAWTGDQQEGGRFVEVDAPLGRPPAFLKQGADFSLRD